MPDLYARRLPPMAGKPLKFVARAWQIPIIECILNNKRCNVWADMGVGKSAATLTALETLRIISDEDTFPVLILAPLRVARDVWPGEMRQWDHLKDLRVSVIVGTAAERLRALHAPADIYAMNYENIPWLIEQCGDKWPFKSVIADESTKLKGFRTRQGTARAHALSTIVRKTSRWVNLTGTPAPNGLKDLWGQAWFLDYGKRLGNTWTAFKDRWFTTEAYTMAVVPKAFAQEQIQKAIADVTLTIQMKDWIDLREPISHPIWVELPPERMKEYRRLEREMFVQLANEIELTALNAAARTNKCLQFAAGAAYHDGDTWTEIHTVKIDALEEIVEETAGANLLVAYWWRHDAARIQKKFPHARILKNNKDVADWNAGKISMLLIHPQSAGHGLNLQHGGCTIIWYSLWWNLEVYLQANERIGPVRQMQSGYERVVTQYHILAKGTLDEEVYERMQSKREVQDLLLDAMKRRNQ